MLFSFIGWCVGLDALRLFRQGRALFSGAIFPIPALPFIRDKKKANYRVIRLFYTFFLTERYMLEICNGKFFIFCLQETADIQ